MKMQVDKWDIGDGKEPIVIAEAGVNHDNDVEKGKELIKRAAESGAEMIKFQNYTADTLVTKNAPRYWSKELDTDEGTTQYSGFNVMNSLTKEDYQKMKDYADELGITYFSTPFNLESVDLLEEIGVNVYKIASGDMTYHQLLKKISKTGKPIIMSVGASSIDEVEESLKVIEKEGNDKIILLHCILSYPCDDKDANLIKITEMKKRFPNRIIGYSDHTRGIIPPIIAMALGADVIEKHYTLTRDNQATSPDHRFAVNPNELKELVMAAKKIEEIKKRKGIGRIPTVEQAYEIAKEVIGKEIREKFNEVLGNFSKEHYAAEQKAYELARRVVVAEKDIKKGEKIEESMLACKRAGIGLAPKYLDSFVGKTAKEDIKRDTIMKYGLVENE